MIIVYDLKIDNGHTVVKSFNTKNDAIEWINNKSIDEQFDFLIDEINVNEFVEGFFKLLKYDTLDICKKFVTEAYIKFKITTAEFDYRFGIIEGYRMCKDEENNRIST